MKCVLEQDTTSQVTPGGLSLGKTLEKVQAGWLNCKGVLVRFLLLTLCEWVPFVMMYKHFVQFIPRPVGDKTLLRSSFFGSKQTSPELNQLNMNSKKWSTIMHLFPCRPAALESTYCHIYIVIRTGVAPTYFVYITYMQGQRVQTRKKRMEQKRQQLRISC